MLTPTALKAVDNTWGGQFKVSDFQAMVLDHPQVNSGKIRGFFDRMNAS
jgi:hypothetical protein